MLIIAEAGINHNGDLNIAKELVDAAIWAKADAIKFQTSWNITRLAKYRFTKDEWKELYKYCNNKGIEFMSTPHEFEAIHFLEPYVKRYKIAHTYLGLPNFLMEVAYKNKPILLSTGNIIHDNGMATIKEIKNALSFIPNADVTLLHCIGKYPCYNPHYERIDILNKLGYKVGLSDHSKNIKVPRRLPIYEKHFMLDDMDCIDKNVSLTQTQFKEMVNYLR